MGWNIVVIDHHTGRIEDRRTFDTCDDFEANRVMTNFILKLPKKKILLGVAHEDAGYKLLQYTLRELVSISTESLFHQEVPKPNLGCVLLQYDVIWGCVPIFRCF